MAPTKTYVERVVSSLTTLQRDKKKSKIHMASLRAHIKNMALANGEKLGGQWSSYVTKAVEKLAEDGTIMHSGHGTITISAAGKKAFTTARRSIAAPGSPVQPDRLAKEVMKDRAKRRRSSAVDGISCSSRRVSKRPRMSTAVSRKTKAQLQEELDELRVQLNTQRNSIRELSPLSDIGEVEDNEETKRLQRLLDEKQDEIDRITHELEEYREQNASQMFGSPSAPVGRSSRAATSEPWSTPMRPRGPLASAIQRTTSGTIIGGISKLTTPPVSPGRHFEPMDMDGDDADDEMPEMQTGDIFAQPAMEHPPTPGPSTPSPIEDDELVALRAEVQELRRQKEVDEALLLEDASNEEDMRTEIAALKGQAEHYEATMSSLRDKLQSTLDKHATQDDLRQEQLAKHEVTELSQQKAEGETTISNLRQQLDEREQMGETLRAEALALRNSLSSRDATISALQTENQALEQRVQSEQAAVGELESKLGVAQGRAVELEGTLKRVEGKLAAEIESVAAYRVQQATTVSALEASVEALTSDKTALSSSLEDSCVQLAEATASLEAALAQLSSTTTQLSDSRTELSGMTAQLAEAEARIADITNDAAATSAEVNLLRDDLATQTQLATQLQQQLETRSTDLERMNLRCEMLEEDVAAKQEANDLLRADNDAKAERISLLDGRLTTLEKSIEELEASAATLRMSMDDLTASMAAELEEKAGVQAGLEAAQVELGVVSAQLKAKTDELTVVSAALDAERKSVLQERQAVVEEKQAVKRGAEALEESQRARAGLEGELLRQRHAYEALLPAMTAYMQAMDAAKAQAQVSVPALSH
ncbi:hypothetical protein CYLTODRAFT_259256 [Cylindrobasidium torrendii FP15055 ss-10]|uniref:Uncharacterized protein n=1 Tax=Cylindrobasidium torrendii FP15055 ss-10 TaxID=1314674 RepID=A0A0D7BFT9_9AGAR|nr:hypothetical protein CYLTODRAFT_259256 [Cylindrobasidium torrendii FP15055 ss-10]